uniref:Uncharacterized protein n=1 Tax=Kalanchoe fedtschenkoi TaxID=63787 RepID=A0A7N0VAT4_KALFE
MGNYLACSTAPKMRSDQSARVILPTGEMRQFREPTKAAELMLECPNFFIAESRSLHLGKRFAALAADEDLEFGSVYVMFSMRRVNSVVTAGDMAMLFMAANAAGKRLAGGGGGGVGIRVSPEERDGSKLDLEGVEAPRINFVEVEGPKLNFEEFEGFNKHRMSVCRSRKPGLETIREEPICLR